MKWLRDSLNGTVPENVARYLDELQRGVSSVTAFVIVWLDRRDMRNVAGGDPTAIEQTRPIQEIKENSRSGVPDPKA